MQITAKTLTGYALNCLDGEIGTVKEFYFDDRHWTIRYLVADTGRWLAGRQVLVSPYALFAASRDQQNIDVHLTKKQIEDSPPLHTHKPVSHQFEDDYYGYYEWPTYWGGPYTWGSHPFMVREHQKESETGPYVMPRDYHLRSTHSVAGYHVQAADGEIGHVEDFVIEDESWMIRYLIVGTRNWWPGRKVLISPKWIKHVSWSESKVIIDLSREIIEGSPEYTEQALSGLDFEKKLQDHYSRHRNELDELVLKEHS